MDGAERRGFARLMLRWPERRAELRRMVPGDVHLCELCGAYEAACEAATFWAKAEGPVGATRAQEYRHLANSVEQDIIERLS